MIAKLLNALSLSALLALLPMATLLRSSQEARAQSSSRPYVVLVNGYQDCCAWSMSTVVQELQDMGAEIRRVPWDSFQDGTNQRSDTSSDSQFILEGVSFIRQLDPDRPLIMIGHSYGGDSLIKLAASVTDREILFLGTIDPVSGGGLRAPVTNYTITDNVRYFFNRWQENGLASSNVVPFDSRISGDINKCDATVCDQEEQSIARNADYSATRISCEAHEVTCDGWTPPGISCEIVDFLPRCTNHSGSNGTKYRRIHHNNMAQDAYIQRQIVEKVTALINQEDLGQTTSPSEGTSLALQVATGLHETDGTFDFDLADWDRDGKPDLVAIKKSNTGSSSTEVHILSGSSNFGQYILQTGTGLHETDGTFDFDLADWDRDGKP